MKGNYTQYECDACETKGEKNIEDQKHILECNVLSEINKTKEIPEYSDIFSNDTKSQLKITRMIMDHMKVRKLFYPQT